MSYETYVTGASNVIRDLQKRSAELEGRRMRAARSAANIFRRHVRAEARAIRGKGVPVTSASGRPGRHRHLLERDVQIEATPLGYVVRDKAPHAHLVVRGTRAHDTPVRTARALSWAAADGAQGFAAVTHNPGAKPNPFVHRAFLRAGTEPAIAARLVLLEGGPDVPDT